MFLVKHHMFEISMIRYYLETIPREQALVNRIFQYRSLTVLNMQAILIDI